jgi:phosphoribosylaminoimidazole-succinocarboxamide synthase
MKLSDEEKIALGFELVEIVKREKPLSDAMMKRLEKHDTNRAKAEIEWEKAQIAEMNAETEEERRFRIDPNYLGNDEWIHQNCFRGDDLGNA